MLNPKWLIALCAPVFILPAAASAGLEISGWYSTGWPRGEFVKYAYGSYAVGGGGRLGWSLGETSAVKPLLFLDFNGLDLGLEQGYVPLDLEKPEIGVDIVTDFYLLSTAVGGAISRRGGDYRPYLEFMGGVTYYASSSRIDSRNRPSGPLTYTSRYSGPTYHLSIGGGIKILLWRLPQHGGEHFLKEAFFDLKGNYLTGGRAEYLDKSSIRGTPRVVEYETLNSKTQLLQIRFGATLLL